jgi:hypothetical protein
MSLTDSGRAVVYDCFDGFAFRVVEQKLGQQHPQESQGSVSRRPFMRG